MGNWISKEEGNTDLPNAPVIFNIGKTVFIKRQEKYTGGTEWEVQIKDVYLSKNFLKELSSEVGGLDENMYVDTIKIEQDGIRDEDFYNEDNISLYRKGATQAIISEAVMNLAVKKLNPNVERLYTSAGQFKFRQNDFDSIEEGSETDLENRDIQQIDNIFYLGQWRKSTNLQEGKGVAIYLDGSLYEGLWKEGERSGIGRMIYSDSSLYQGEWFRDMPNGYGIFISQEMDNLKGYWNEGKIHGWGFEIMENGNTYRGEFVEGRK